MRNAQIRVCGNAFQILTKTRFYKNPKFLSNVQESVQNRVIRIDIFSIGIDIKTIVVCNAEESE